MIVYPLQDSGTMLVRGYEVRRTDSFDLQSEALDGDRNLMPVGETISPSGLSVVKQILYFMIMEGYILLKSITATIL